MNDSSVEPEHHISTRELTSAEREDLRAAPPSTWPGTALIFFVWGVVPSLALGLAGRWLGGMERFDAPVLGQFLGAALGLGLFSMLWLSTRNSARAQERLVQADLDQGSVQVVASRGARFRSPERPASDPELRAEIGDGATLSLQGAWLTEGERFGRAQPDDEAGWEDSHFNSLPEPWAFPSPAFTLHRLPVSGRVLRIEVEGPYVEPTPAGESERFTYHPADSVWLDRPPT